MNRLTLDLETLHHNMRTVDGWVTAHGASWSLVTKVLCGHGETLRGLQLMGVSSMADSRLGNLEAIAALPGPVETWYLRLPHMPAIEPIVRMTDVSLNSESAVIHALNREAGRQDKLHRVVIMIELGDLREGVLPGSLLGFYAGIFELPHIEVLGVGSNLGCLSGAVPSLDQFSQLSLYRELLELKFGRKLPMISGGTSAVLPMLRDGQLPRAVNHFRIGESVFLGTDLVNGGILAGLRDDAVTLEVEIVEMREKSLTPQGETTDMTPFEDFQIAEHAVGERGYRAVVTVGQLDTEVRGLAPLDDRYAVVGASSDLAVVHVGDNPEGLKVGDTISFRPSYGALVRLMHGRYIDKIVVPDLEAWATRMSRTEPVDLPPVIDSLTDESAE
ncbi:MAG: alanine racemase [Candidatus Krumholzibacteriia bacterium]